MSAGEASAVEQRALRTSLWVGISFAVISAVWGLVARSEVILLNAIFTPLYLLMTSGSLFVSRIVAKGPSRMFPFGRDALVPLFVIAQAIILFGALGYAILEAVRVILEGGFDVAGISLLTYGVFSALVGLITWRVLLRMARGRPLVEAEAAGWFSAVPSSGVIAVGGVVVLLLGGTRFAAAAPYVDPTLVIIGSLGFAVIPASLLRRSLRDLQTARPHSELVARVETVLENVRTAEACPNLYSGSDASARHCPWLWHSCCHPAPETSLAKTGSAARCAKDSGTCPTTCGSPSSSATTPNCSSRA